MHAEVMAASTVEREALRLPAVMPNVMVGQIVGLVYLPGKSLQVEECQMYPWRHWAIGSIRNLVTHVAPLEPSSFINAHGNQAKFGYWSVHHKNQAGLKEQVATS